MCMAIGNRTRTATKMAMKSSRYCMMSDLKQIGQNHIISTTFMSENPKETINLTYQYSVQRTQRARSFELFVSFLFLVPFVVNFDIDYLTLINATGSPQLYISAETSEKPCIPGCGLTKLLSSLAALNGSPPHCGPGMFEHISSFTSVPAS